MIFGKDYTKGWEKWFAWYPVKVGTQWIWLETVQKYYNPHYFVWTYKK